MEIVKTNRDFLILVEICREISTLSRLFEPRHVNNLEIWNISVKKFTNYTTSRLRSRKSVEICYNFHFSTDISIKIEIFCSEKVIESLSSFLNLDRDVLIVETKILTLLRFSLLSRLTF
jgi:hypothetical protein